MSADLAHPHNRLIVDDYELAPDGSYRLRTVGTGEGGLRLAGSPCARSRAGGRRLERRALPPAAPTAPSRCTATADLLRFFRQHDLHTILVPDVRAAAAGELTSAVGAARGIKQSTNEVGARRGCWGLAGRGVWRPVLWLAGSQFWALPWWGLNWAQGPGTAQGTKCRPAPARPCRSSWWLPPPLSSTTRPHRCPAVGWGVAAVLRLHRGRRAPARGREGTAAAAELFAASPHPPRCHTSPPTAFLCLPPLSFLPRRTTRS